MSKRQTPYECGFNRAILCEKIFSTSPVCSNCGWNPRVEKERKEQLRKKMGVKSD